MGKVKNTREIREQFEASVYEIELYFNLRNIAKFDPKRKFRFLNIYSKKKEIIKSIINTFSSIKIEKEQTKSPKEGQK